jgi:hypothetical protein
MKMKYSAILCLSCLLMADIRGFAQEGAPAAANLTIIRLEAPAPAASCGGPSGCHWTRDCFPRCGCPDDYCPRPFPRQCWPPYPPYYQCVPAGECGHPPCVGVGNEKLTWWFFPTPRALYEALWCRP